MRGRGGCASDGELRAQLDGELGAGDAQRVAEHLQACPACRARMAQIERVARWARQGLVAVSPPREPDLSRAEARVRALARQRASAQTLIRRLWMSTTSGKHVWRPIVAGVVVLALLVGTFSFAPSRALARQLLAVFRVRRFAVVQISPDQAQLEQVGRALENKLFVGPPEVVADEAPVTVASVEEARRVAGFDVRAPGVPLVAEGSPRIEVKGRTEYVFRFKREGLALLLEMAGMDPRLIPSGFSEGALRVSAPAAAYIRGGGIELVQVYNPSITYPDGIDPRVIGQAALRLMGVSAEDARRISERLDWNTTLLLPVPRDLVEFREVRIAGEEAVFLRARREQGSSNPGQALLWQKGDVVCMLTTAYTNTDRIIQIAESMYKP